MSNKRTFIGILVFALVAGILALSQTTNFFGQGLVFTPGAQIQVEGPREIQQDECMSNRVISYTSADEVPIHTLCNAGEFEIGSQEELTNVVVEIKKADTNEVVARHRNFEPIMNSGQIDSVTWDGVTCGTGRTPCEPGEYYIQATARHEDGHFPTARWNFRVVGPTDECPIDETIALEHINLISSYNETQTTQLDEAFRAINLELQNVRTSNPEFTLPELPIAFTYDNFVSEANSVLSAMNTSMATDSRCDGIVLPLVPELLTPEDNAINVSINPTFSWDAHPQALRYGLVVSTSEDLSDPVIEKADILTNSYTLNSAEALDYNTKYYWTGYAANTAGSARYPHTFEFTTAASPSTLTCTLTADEGSATNPFVPNEEIVRITYEASTGDASEVNFGFNITDSSGTSVASIPATKISWPQENSYIDWDGKDSNGNKVASDTYNAQLYIATLQADGTTVENECNTSLDIVLQNRSSVDITVSENVLLLGQPLEIVTKIPFEYKKKVINVYNEEDDLIDTVTYECARGESCPIESSQSKFLPEEETLYYDGIKSNGEPLIPGTKIRFKLWVKPVTGSSENDYSQNVVVNGSIKNTACEFVDVPPGHPDYNAVQYVCSKGLFEGHPDKTMRLNENLTRAQLMVVAGRLGEQTGVCREFRPYDQRLDRNVGYSDVTSVIISDPRNTWKLDALVFTTNCGIIRGYADGTVRLDSIMTHAEWWKAALISGRLFASSENFDPWFIEYEQYLTRLGLFPPNGLNRINRGDAIRLLYSLRTYLQI